MSLIKRAENKGPVSAAVLAAAGAADVIQSSEGQTKVVPGGESRAGCSQSSHTVTSEATSVKHPSGPSRGGGVSNAAVHRYQSKQGADFTPEIQNTGKQQKEQSETS